MSNAFHKDARIKYEHDGISVCDDLAKKEKGPALYAPDPSNLNKSIFHGQVFFVSYSRWSSARRSSVVALSPPLPRAVLHTADF
ncbi:MAG: hypothetical protein HOL07_16350 [Rhodospirillaceae bacterium]|jgi:hypothetical protein|nr:hypothetical protein [Rhodospirillaceae bacterium]MBT3929083.1 hypothetical protein [Rhodospirillaceae bacterium]MBT4773471.1 hypothetical protein [Rhodospirillaceae bacterium]MBT5359913.1 hypothetical protein [Rhodospirillaceae bacterium]MBT5769444.1 hypothetical protein [Rhodospirillaceae bacterium]